MRIGMFDSGIGGLTILHHAMKYLPKEEFIYYADTEHVPYGTKTREQVVSYCEAATEFLIQQGCDLILIACNTATSVAASLLREKYTIPIIGVEPAVKPAVEHSRQKRILVIATPITVREKKLQDLIARVDEQHLVYIKALAMLPEFAERGEFESESVQRYLEAELHGIAFEAYSHVVLGCTHFNHFKEALSAFFPSDCEFIDGSEGTVKNMVHTLQSMNLQSAGKLSVRYYQTGKPVADEATLKFYQSVLDRLDWLENQPSNMVR